MISNFQSKNLKEHFWKQIQSKITTQTKNNNLDYLIDSAFRNINRLFVLSFKNGDNDPTRYSFDKYYMSLAELEILMH